MHSWRLSPAWWGVAIAMPVALVVAGSAVALGGLAALDAAAPVRHAWWALATPCSAELAWPVGTCGVGEYLSPLDFVIAACGLGTPSAAALVLVANVVVGVVVASRLGGGRWGSALLGVLGGAGPVVIAMLQGGTVGPATVALVGVAALAWHAARTGGFGTVLLASGATVLAALGGVPTAVGASVVALALALGGGPARVGVALVAGAAALALACVPYTMGPVAPAPELARLYSLPVDALALSDRGVPAITLVLAAYVAWRGETGPRAVARAGLACLVLALGPELVTSSGAVEGSHFPLLALHAIPGGAAFDHAGWLVGPAVLLVAVAVAAWIGPGRPWPLAVVSLAVAGQLAWERPPLRLVGGSPQAAPWALALAQLPPGVTAVLPLAPELRSADTGLEQLGFHRHVLLDAPRAWVGERRPRGWGAAIHESSFLAEWVRFERGREVPGDPTRANFFRSDPADVSRLRADGLRYLVVAAEDYAPRLWGLAPASRVLATRLLGDAVASGSDWAIWALPESPVPAEVTAPAWRMPSTLRDSSWPGSPAD